MGINGNYLLSIILGCWDFHHPKGSRTKEIWLVYKPFPFKTNPMIGPPNITPTISPEELDGQHHSYSNPGPCSGGHKQWGFPWTLLNWTPAMEKQNIPFQILPVRVCQRISSRPKNHANKHKRFPASGGSFCFSMMPFYIHPSPLLFDSISENPNLDLASKPPKAPAAEDDITWGLHGWHISLLLYLSSI